MAKIVLVGAYTLVNVVIFTTRFKSCKTIFLMGFVTWSSVCPSRVLNLTKEKKKPT